MRIFYIAVSIILLTSIQARSQAKGPMPDPEPAKIARFYPNPAITFITFELIEKEASQNYSLQIYNFLGKKVKDIPDVNAKTTVNLTDFNRGIYIFQLKESSGKIAESGRFQINK